jgi:hypothetical protein
MPVCIAAALLFAAGAAPAVEVGVVATVNPDAQGTPPGQATRTLTTGADVFHEERIVTATTGQTQIMFLDRSSITIGAGSDVVLDSFVYDPDATTGKMAVSVTTGVLRFIGGRIAKNEDVVFETPHATIGIRGSSLNLDALTINVLGQIIAHRTSGRMFCKRDDKVFIVTVDNKVCVADENGLRIEDLDPEWLKRIHAALQGDGDGLDPLQVIQKVNAECGSTAAVQSQRCGDGGPFVPDPKEFEKDLEQFIQDEQRDDLEMEDCQECCEVCDIIIE